MPGSRSHSQLGFVTLCILYWGISCLGLDLSPQLGGQGPDPVIIVCVAHKQYLGNIGGVDEHKWGRTLQWACHPKWTMGLGCYPVFSKEQAHTDPLCKHNWILFLGNVAAHNSQICLQCWWGRTL